MSGVRLPTDLSDPAPTAHTTANHQRILEPPFAAGVVASGVMSAISAPGQRQKRYPRPRYVT
jgi:hypothetical protein